MKTSLFILFFVVYTPLNAMLFSNIEVESLINPWLSAGGMGILGYLLFNHIQAANKTFSSLSKDHRDGLIEISKELKGLREDIRADLKESNKLLSRALGLGSILAEELVEDPKKIKVK